MSRLQLIGVTACAVRSGLDTSRAAGPLRLRAASFAAGLAGVCRHRTLRTTLLFIKAAIATGVPPRGVCRAVLSGKTV